jgi:hypothetical protein
MADAVVVKTSSRPARGRRGGDRASVVQRVPDAFEPVDEEDA